MRTWILALIFCVACNSQAKAPAADAGPGAPAAAPPTIVFLGDSLTAGYGLSEEEAVPAVIQRKIDQAKLGYRVINGGRSGDTSAGGLARLNWYLRPDVNLHVLVIGLGSNDAMRGLALPALEENLRQIIKRTRAHKSDARLLIWAMKTFPNMGPDYGGAYEEVFARVGREENVTVIPFPLIDVAGKPELNQEDSIHPTREGTEKVAERIWAALQPVL